MDAEFRKMSGYLKGKNEYDPMAVRWLEKYGTQVDAIWGKVPGIAKPVFVTFAVFTLGTAIKGEWIIFMIHLLIHLGVISPSAQNIKELSWDNITLESLYLKDVGKFIFWSSFVGYVIYFGLGGFIQWYFYVRQRDRPYDWKIQPTKFMDPALERHEIIFGSITLFCNGFVSAIVSCIIYNGGYCALYYNFFEYNWVWTILQLPLLYIFMDYITYLMHRMFHLPLLYKHFHKMHHKYTHPTAFSVTAIHPVESVFMQVVLILPIYFVPLHYLTFYSIVFYNYYHGIIDHSGVDFKSFWWQPWQPDAVFHDNHHQYFHVNFGFNMSLWDKLHGTYRRKDRIYTEDDFYGGGKALKDATEAEIKADMAERLSENPIAYRSKKLEFVEETSKDAARNKKK